MVLGSDEEDELKLKAIVYFSRKFEVTYREFTGITFSCNGYYLYESKKGRVLKDEPKVNIYHAFWLSITRILQVVRQVI